jgi:predicted glycoside hydrolase/deacetylase ChbG (UPF0249 family)
VPSLVESLGFPAGDRLLILTCDGLGVCHSTNVAVYQALREGVASSGTLNVPGPWARDAAARYRGEEIGVSLTLISEHDLLRWGPITHSPSLLDGDGGFPRTLVDLWDHADTDEVRRECRAQIERAIYWGFDVTYLSCHMGALEARPEFFDVALELAADFGLPLRLPEASAERSAGFPFRSIAAQGNVLAPDHLIRPSPARRPAPALDAVLADLQPGVTEVVLSPAVDSSELRSALPDWPTRLADFEAVMSPDSLRVLSEHPEVHVGGYRALRDLQRRLAATKR